MRQPDLWKPTKYVSSAGRLRASRDPRCVGVASRHITDLIAALYAKALPRYARGDLLDLGCGTVPLFGEYRQLVTSTTCVDWPASPHALQHVDVAADLSEPLPLADESFDTILLSDVLEHLPNPSSAMREVARLLRPGGHLILNTPFLYPIHEAPHDFYRYTRFALARIATDAGLKVEVLVPVGDHFDALVDSVAKAAVRNLPLGGGVGRLVQLLGSIRRPADDFSTRDAETPFPLGYFMVALSPPSAK